jgi:thioredoxin 1
MWMMETMSGVQARWVAAAVAVLLSTAACSGGEQTAQRAEAAGAGVVKAIGSKTELEQALTAAGDKLVLLDLFAEWCGPCKVLSPVLEEIARERADLVSVYKIDIDRNPAIGRQFQVSGIPLVVFMKKGQRVHAVMGLNPKATYLRDIERFAEPGRTSADETPDGELVDGVRVIRIGAVTTLGSLYVFRGETVRLVFEATGYPFAISIPQYEVSESSPAGAELEVSFKAPDIGAYPVYCNGRCPSGDGQRLGQVVVVPLASSEATRFTELSADDAQRLITRGAILVDVRTPNEYYEGHIEGARLIPLQQLEGRIGELANLREQPILLYCRSGNRSTVAAEILMRQGFKDLYNLRHGVQDWVKRGLPMVT